MVKSLVRYRYAPLQCIGLVASGHSSGAVKSLYTQPEWAAAFAQDPYVKPKSRSWVPSSSGTENSAKAFSFLRDGWTPVSDFFLDNYWKLEPRVKGAEVLLIVHLLRYKWDADAPFPAFKTLAKKMGVSSTAVRNHARSLELKGYLRREMRVGSTNRFDLTPLFKALEKLQLVQEQERIDAELDKF